MSLNLEVIYDADHKGRRIVLASILDLSLLPQAERIYGPVSCTNLKRCAEKYSSTILVEQLYPGTALEHGSGGEPVLTACKEYSEISVSHTADKIAMIFSNANTGIDIENSERNMSLVANRFLSPEEREIAGKNGLVAAWCAKEAFYKYLKGKGVTFLNDYTIRSFSSEEIVMEYLGKRFYIDHTVIGNITLACI